MAPTRRTLLQASAIGFAGSIAGCTGAGDASQDTETEMETTQQTTETTDGTDETQFTVQVTTHAEHGVVLTDGEGMVLYLFTPDEGGESTCYDDCAEAWPPLTVDGSVNVPDGLPGEFDTTERDDGAMQVTYNGAPLYYFVKDEEPGDANGQGLNDVWFVLNPSCPSETETTVRATTTEEDGEGY